MDYRYILFIHGKYSRLIPGAYLNFCISSLALLDPETAINYPIPEDMIRQIFWGMIYNARQHFVSGLLNAIVDGYTDTVICFDNELCEVFVYKGDGDVDTLFTNALPKIEAFYRHYLEAEFEYVNIFDRR